MPPNTVSVARPGRWGNPYRVDLLGRELAIAMLRNELTGFFDPYMVKHLSDAEFSAMYDARELWRRRLGYSHPRDALSELRGLNLACWCSLDEPCHGDPLLELANRRSP